MKKEACVAAWTRSTTYGNVLKMLVPLLPAKKKNCSKDINVFFLSP